MADFLRDSRVKIQVFPVLAVIAFIGFVLSAMFHSPQPAPSLAAAAYVINPNTQSFTYQPMIVESITIKEIFWLLILGFISGMVGGMLGMGGGLLKLSGMYLFLGYEVILARVITLMTYSCIAISAFYRYRKFDLILWDVAKKLAGSAIVGVVAGVLLGNIITGVWLEKLLGIYAIIIGITMFFQVNKGNVENDGKWENNNDDAKITFIGILKGFFCGLFGISGGIISVPLQQFMLKMPVKNAIANSLSSAMFSATFAAALALTTGIASGFFRFSSPLLLALPLIPGTIIGAKIGARLTRQMDTSYIKLLFAVIALAMGARILFFMA